MREMRDTFGWVLALLVSLIVIQSAADALYSQATQTQAMDDGGGETRD